MQKSCVFALVVGVAGDRIETVTSNLSTLSQLPIVCVA
jgi:hypothetical protein